MHIITKTFKFDASHQLMHHDGKCARLHGHTYTMVLELTASALATTGPQTNMVTDFTLISHIAKKLIASHLDHHHLNDTLQTDSPTAEYIAQWCYHQLHPALPTLTAVAIHETASSSATYRPRPQYLYAPCPHCSRCAPPPHTNGTLSTNINKTTKSVNTNGTNPTLLSNGTTNDSKNNNNSNNNNKPTLNTPTPIPNGHHHEPRPHPLPQSIHLHASGS